MLLLLLCLLFVAITATTWRPALVQPVTLAILAPNEAPRGKGLRTGRKQIEWTTCTRAADGPSPTLRAVMSDPAPLWKLLLTLTAITAVGSVIAWFIT